MLSGFDNSKLWKGYKGHIEKSQKSVSGYEFCVSTHTTIANDGDKRDKKEKVKRKIDKNE
jgi:hypothetical protein